MGDRFGPLALAALAPAAMLAVDPAGWYPFGPVKWLGVSVLVLAGSALVLRTQPVRLPRSLLVALAGFLGWLAVAAAFGSDPTYAWLGTPERHFGMLTWGLCALALVVGRSLSREGQTATVVSGVVLAALGVGAVATLEAFGWEPEVLDAGRRLTGTFGSSAYLGAAAALLLPIAGGVALDRDGVRARRSIGALAVALLAVALVGSGARAAWFGVLVAALVVLGIRRRWAATQIRARAGRAVLALGGVVGVVVVVLVLTPAGARLTSVTDDGAPGGQGRIDEWRVATRVVRDHPILGAGPEGYRVEVPGAIDADYERDHGRDPHPDRAHSLPLDLLLAGGVGALVGWGAIAVLVGRSVGRALREGPPWLVGLAAGLVAHVAGQLVLFPVFELEPLVWLLAGIVMVHAPVDRRPRVRPPVPRLAIAGLGAVALLAVAGGVTDIVADHRADAASEALARGDTREAADEALAAVDLRPDIVRLRLLAAVAVVEDDRGIVAGLAQLDDALDVSPEDPILLLARVRLLADRAAATGVDRHLEEARSEVERLLVRDPNNVRLWRVAEAVALRAGDAAGAQRAASIVEDLDPPERDA